MQVNHVKSLVEQANLMPQQSWVIFSSWAGHASHGRMLSNRYVSAGLVLILRRRPGFSSKRVRSTLIDVLLLLERILWTGGPLDVNVLILLDWFPIDVQVSLLHAGVGPISEALVAAHWWAGMSQWRVSVPSEIGKVGFRSVVEGLADVVMVIGRWGPPSAVRSRVGQLLLDWGRMLLTLVFSLIHGRGRLNTDVLLLCAASCDWSH